MSKNFWLLALTVAHLGCSSPRDVALTTILQTSHCPIAKPGLTLYQTPEAFTRAMEGESADSHALKQQLEPVNGGGAAAALEDGNWAIVANLGQQPSAGYSVQLASSTAQLSGKTLTLQLQQSSPRAGTMQAAVVTTPCVVIGFAAQQIEQIIASTADQRWQLTLENGSAQPR